MKNLAFIFFFIVTLSVHLSAQKFRSVHVSSGLKMLVAEENVQPTLSVILPGCPESDRSIEIIFPEHVTVRRHDSDSAEHLYLFSPGSQGERPIWKQSGKSLEYERNLSGAVNLLAQARLEDDGVRIRYEFSNQSDTMYDMIYAVTCPRLTNLFHDLRMQRTYVHYKDGFQLLASEIPDRIDMPIDQWLPCRCLASFTWPIPSPRIEHREDGITYYNSSRAVDIPLVATLSSNDQWVVASFTHDTGNVWSNPELTCQHVDPQAPLPPGQKVVLEIKILIIRGSLDDVLKKYEQQR